MKAQSKNLTNLLNSYVNAIGYEAKSQVNNLAKEVLSQSDFMVYIDKCIFYNSVDFELLEAELGLSGVQNKDNL
jgi:hypothetical protein